MKPVKAFIMPPPRRGGGIKRSSASVVRRPSVCLSVCLSDVAYIGSNSKTKRPRKTKLCTGYPRSHATPTPTSRSKGQKSRSRGGAYCGGHLAAQLVMRCNTDNTDVIWKCRSPLKINAHRAVTRLHYCSEKHRIPYHQPTLWPPNLPNLNLVDYCVLRVLQDRVIVRGWPVLENWNRDC